MRQIKYKGYIVTQVKSNNHIWLAKDGKHLMHSQCDTPKTDDELREFVDNYIKMIPIHEKIIKDMERNV